MSLYESQLKLWRSRISPGCVVSSSTGENFLVIDRLTWGDDLWLTVQCTRGVVVKPSTTLLPLDESEIYGDNYEK
jgi:hypothetical protein